MSSVSASSATSASSSSPSSSDTSASTSSTSSTTSTTSTTSNTSPSSGTSSPTDTSSSSSSSASASGSGTSSTPLSSSATPTSSASTLTGSLTTDITTTVVSTSADGQVFTTVVRTSTTLPPGATVTSSSSDSSNSSSDSHTGAIVGGAVGGGAALILLFVLVGLWWKRSQRKQKSLDAFDGNFDPDRIVTTKPMKGEPKAFRGQGPTLPNVENGADNGMEDDGMGGRLAGSTLGAGVVAPYPLYHPTNPQQQRSPPSPPEMSAQHTGVSTNYPSSSQGMSSQGQSSSQGGLPASVYAAAYGDQGRAPTAPSVAGSTSTTPYGFGAGERLPNPYQNQNQPAPGSTVSTSTHTNTSAPGQGYPGYGRFNVANPDAEGGGPSSFVGGFNPTSMPRRSEKSTAALNAARPPRDVLVHQDGGRVENQMPREEEEGPEEIPPTYDSLVPDGTSGSGSGAREKR
ncbi:hypothetical protein GGU10DRAFT_348394 [Lentinula aff. detonsa]|uniref:REJ domain-containing protein n=1 Tax=Lentinula aff. detonsa TaxID=2804958 RepID=A0AA38NN16_9AGAR|nr:hypothetical protein GGU10DRAFT_348394 [Lentinula aff. detonsa]